VPEDFCTDASNRHHPPHSSSAFIQQRDLAKNRVVCPKFAANGLYTPEELSPPQRRCDFAWIAEPGTIRKYQAGKKSPVNNKTKNQAIDAAGAVAQAEPIAKPVKKAARAGWTESSSDWVVPPDNADVTTPSPVPIALQARNLALRYGPTQALNEVSFTLRQGDTLGLLGLNGAGKSTLLKVLAGALAPDNGTVHVGENELFERTVAGRMDIGYAPDKPAVYPEFRVTEYLRFIARMRRIHRRNINTSVDHVIERCALGGVRQRIIGNLSTGFQQRINIAQALLHTPDVLILDEPTNGLDPVQIVEMRELVTSLAPEQATIFSSHQLPEVNAICNRVILIHNGLQIMDAPLDKLSNSENNTFEVWLDDNDIDLQELPGVNGASRIMQDHWLVTGKSLTSEHLTAMLASRGQRVAKVSPAENYLESLFRQLAATDQTNPDSKHTKAAHHRNNGAEV